MAIYKRDLEQAVEELNELCGFAADRPYSTIGSYGLSVAYNGYSLHQYVTNGGGIRDVFRSCHIKGRELYPMIQDLISDIRDKKRTAEKVLKALDTALSSADVDQAVVDEVTAAVKTALDNQ